MTKKTLESYLAKAKGLQQEGRISEAIAELRRALRATEDKAAIHKELAVLFSQQHLSLIHI